ncbi:MAG: hypothetical protein ACLR0I_01630 [Streptococcus salivarius]
MTHKPRDRQSNFLMVVSSSDSCIKVFSKLSLFLQYMVGACLPRASYTIRNSCRCPYNGLCNTWINQLLHAFNVKSVYQSVFKVGLFRTRLSTGQFQWPSFLMATIVVPGFNNLFHVSHLV